MDILEQCNNILSSSVSEFKHVDYLVPENKLLNTYEMRNKFYDINRLEKIYEIDNHIKNLSYSHLIEAGIFEYVITYIYDNDLNKTLIESTYNNIFNDIIKYIDPSSQRYSQHCIDNINNGNFNPQELAFMPSYEINPDSWEKSLKRQQLKEFKKNNIPTTELYTCRKCGQKKCKITETQSRSADEPMTSFIVCINCNNTFKK